MKTKLLELLGHLITKAASDGKEEVRLALLELRERVHGMEDEDGECMDWLSKVAKCGVRAIQLPAITWEGGALKGSLREAMKAVRDKKP